MLFNSTALILKRELVVVNLPVGNQHTLGVFIWQNFVSCRISLKDLGRSFLTTDYFPLPSLPTTQRNVCGGESYQVQGRVVRSSVKITQG